MKGKNIVLTVAIVAACAGTAMAAPRAVKSDMTPTRIVPSFIAPVYLVDGVEVIGEKIPYTDTRPTVTGRRVVFDQYDGDQTVADDYPPIDRGGPCGGAGFLFTSGADSAATDYFRVNVSHSTDDYKGVDAFGVGKNVTGVALLWNHFQAEPMAWIVRSLTQFNENNDPNFGAAGPRTRTYSGLQTIGVAVYFGAAQQVIAPGFYYSYVDWAGAIVQPALDDTDGAVNFAFHRDTAVFTAATLADTNQPASWGTRPDELPAPSSLPRPGGVQNPFWYIDDSGAIKSAPYNFANAIENGIITPAGADGGPDETVTTGPSTDPVDCFRSTGICWALFVQECVAADAATLISPPNGATGVANPPSFEWAPGAVIAPDYSIRIKKNGNVVYQEDGILTTTFTLGTTLQQGQAYGWVMVSNAGAGCEGTESELFTFRIAGCGADFNNDGVVDFFDYLDFVDAFSGNGDFADYNADQVIDFFDYLDFVDAFSIGCPG